MLSQEHSFVLACEHLLNITISDKSKLIRTLMDEITRILNHIMCITTQALDVGALTPFLWGFEEREKLLYFYEKLSGARMHSAFYRIGGVWSDLPDFFLNEIILFTSNFLSYINILHDTLSLNKIWINRLSGIGILNKKNAILYSCSGPVLRGSGIPWDIRKIQPYESYNNIKFNIPVGFSYDCYSRYCIRYFEIIESLNIINQCSIELLNINNSKVYTNFNSKNSFKFNMENLIYHFKSFSAGIKIPEGTTYICVEAPKGETGILLISDNSNKPFRCKIKSPGFLHLQTLNYISQNYLLADLVTNIGSLDIVFGEIDR